MTFISNSRAEELAKTLATQKTTISQKVEKTPENSNNETNVKTKGDEAKIENSNKSDNTLVLNLFDNDINIDDLRKKILAGENVTITFPNMSKDQLIKKLFPDAKEVITAGDLSKKFEENYSTYHSSESTYVSKEFGKFSVTSFSGCFTSGIKINKIAPDKEKNTILEGLKLPEKNKPQEKGSILEGLKLPENPKEPKMEYQPELKPIYIDKNSSDEPISVDKNAILNKLNEKGKVFIKHSDFNNMSDEAKIKELFPNAKITGSHYERPSVTISFSDEKGNKYKAVNIVDGFVQSQGITIIKDK